mgnify:CR=1 FL=1
MQVWPTLTMAALGAVLEVLDPRLASSRTHRPVVGIGEGEGQIHSTTTRDAFTIERTGLPVRSTLVLATPFGSASRPKNSLAEQLFGEKQRDIKFANSSGKLLFIYCCDPEVCFDPLQLRVDFFFERSRCRNTVLNSFSSLQISF